jgi:hypothetical protein
MARRRASLPAAATPDRQVDGPRPPDPARARSSTSSPKAYPKEIARARHQRQTAENHRARVLDKVGVRNTAGLVRFALRRALD